MYVYDQIVCIHTYIYKYMYICTRDWSTTTIYDLCIYIYMYI